MVLVGTEVLDRDVDGVVGKSCWTATSDQAPLVLLCRTRVLTRIELLSLLLQINKANLCVASRRDNAVPFFMLNAFLLL